MNKQKLILTAVLSLAFVFTASAVYASLTFSSTTITGISGNLTADSFQTLATNTGPTTEVDGYEAEPVKMLLSTATNASYALALVNEAADTDKYATYITNLADGELQILSGSGAELQMYATPSDFADPFFANTWSFVGDVVSANGTSQLGREDLEWGPSYFASLTTAVDDRGDDFQGSPAKVLIQQADGSAWSLAMSNAAKNPAHYGAGMGINDDGTFYISAGKDQEVYLQAFPSDFPATNLADSWGFDSDLISPNGYTLGRATAPWAGVYSTSVRTMPVAFSALVTCNSGAKGTIAFITDSTTNTWGATVAGGGANNVGVSCNGTNWTVYSK